jgi:hypothetical protein
MVDKPKRRRRKVIALTVLLVAFLILRKVTRQQVSDIEL